MGSSGIVRAWMWILRVRWRGGFWFRRAVQRVVARLGRAARSVCCMVDPG